MVAIQILAKGDAVLNILIIGATSAIAQGCVDAWVARAQPDQRPRFFLVGRQQARLAPLVTDLAIRLGGEVGWACADVLDRADQARWIAEAQAFLGSLDVVLVAAGTLPDQPQCEQDADAAMQALDVNATALIGVLTRLAQVLEAQRHGTLAVISSVAGDRGRASNYVYGAAKAALSTFCSGLNARLSACNVQVLTIKPGFVDTPMTAGLGLSGPLVAQPEQVGAQIVKAIDRRKDVLYVPWFWGGIMLVIRLIPRFIFKKLKF